MILLIRRGSDRGVYVCNKLMSISLASSVVVVWSLWQAIPLEFNWRPARAQLSNWTYLFSGDGQQRPEAHEFVHLPTKRDHIKLSMRPSFGQFLLWWSGRLITDDCGGGVSWNNYHFIWLILSLIALARNNKTAFILQFDDVMAESGQWPSQSDDKWSTTPFDRF